MENFTYNRQVEEKISESSLFEAEFSFNQSYRYDMLTAFKNGCQILVDYYRDCGNEYLFDEAVCEAYENASEEMKGMLETYDIDNVSEFKCFLNGIRFRDYTWERI